ncbi:MAG: hypothetical protein K2L71_06250, partial [Muribaculaceae bacterium]|nr:hypothetical protein [Muribaculaceae bacterium]
RPDSSSAAFAPDSKTDTCHQIIYLTNIHPPIIIKKNTVSLYTIYNYTIAKTPATPYLKR